MEGQQSKIRLKTYIMIFAIAFSNIVYLIPYLSLSFYNQFLEAYHMTDGQMGAMMTFFGLTAIPGYLLGGWIGDIFNPKKLVVLSCVATGAVAAGVALNPSYPVLLVMYGLYGITSTCLHWGAYLKVIRKLGDESEQGRLYGVANMGYMLFSLFLEYVILMAMTKFMGTHPMGFRLGILVYAVLSMLIGLLIYKIVPDDGKDSYEKGTGVNLGLIGKALKMPITWHLSFFTLGYFMVLMSLPYLNPNLSADFGISMTFATFFAITAKTGSVTLMAPTGGFIRDRILKGRSTKLVMTCATLSIICSIVLACIPRVAALGWIMMVVGVLAYFTSGALATTLYTPVTEAKVPVAFTGTVLGIASAIGYSSDAWLYRVCGYFIDNYGSVGYTYIWWFTVLGGVMMLITGYGMWRAYQKAAAQFD